jgi:hypothetical protein
MTELDHRPLVQIFLAQIYVVDLALPWTALDLCSIRLVYSANPVLANEDRARRRPALRTGCRV